MLVLTRKQGEKIRIGKDVTITVIRMKGKAIRLGIEAPHHLSVLRGELCDREAFGLCDVDQQPQDATTHAETAAPGAAENTRTNGNSRPSEKPSASEPQNNTQQTKLARPEQAVASDAWPPQQSKPLDPCSALPDVASGGTSARSENRPLRSMVERRARTAESR